MGTSLFVGGLLYSDIARMRDYVVDCLRAPNEPSQSLTEDSVAVEANKLIESWSASDSNNLVIDTLNEASIVLFLNYAAKLEGLPSSADGTSDSKWRHLPYWDGSIWFPLASSRLPVVADIGGPMFIGTYAGLLDDLHDIARKSDLRLGERPKYFDLMINSPKLFHEIAWDALDDETTIRWIWSAYTTGAQRAIAENRPLWQ